MVLVSQRPRHEKKLKEMCRSCKLWLFSSHRLGEAAVRDLSFHFSIRKVQISIIPHENHENLFRRLIAATRPEMKSHGSSHRHKEQHIAFLIFSTVIFFMGKFSYWMGQAVFHHFFSLFWQFPLWESYWHSATINETGEPVHASASHTPYHLTCVETPAERKSGKVSFAWSLKESGKSESTCCFVPKMLRNLFSGISSLSEKRSNFFSAFLLLLVVVANDDDDRAERTISFSSSDDKLTKHHHHQSDFERCRWKTWKHDNLTKF